MDEERPRVWLTILSEVCSNTGSRRSYDELLGLGWMRLDQKVPSDSSSSELVGVTLSSMSTSSGMNGISGRSTKLDVDSMDILDANGSLLDVVEEDAVCSNVRRK
ncbi:hypothetical protein PHLCEN_2v1005 [Hermanssonia centrifuga]|uniref:Uncharacterized protein n=1 Tax=Hermanssonia centrifuga TaxID=98765 RepID=A0A2R6S4E1_9APHY|nr:hypothetical protein PHLCEN_2v1005 [Hermanssonia centrifuga]